MNCDSFLACLDPYVDGELGVNESLTADTHAAECPGCRSVVARERGFRQLLRHQPRETAPPELRRRIRARLGRASRVAVLRPWLAVPVAAAAAAVLVLVVARPGGQDAGLVGDLVNTHIAFAQIERPAELVSTSHGEVAEWFLARARLRVTVPDYSPAGIRLVGGRLSDVRGRQAAYIVYEKGRTLLSVFMAPAPRDAALSGRTVEYGGHTFLTREQQGYHTVSWTDGQAVFGLVSMLDYQALLECAARLRDERASQTRL